MKPSKQYLQDCTPLTFTEADYLRAIAADYNFTIRQLHTVLSTPAGRVRATKESFLLFCMLYLRSSFVLDVGPNAGQFTVNDLLLLAARTDIYWHNTPMEPKQHRWIWAYPREEGKSTIVLKAIPLWLGCHQLTKFIAAFSNTDEQAFNRLSAIRNVIRDNKKIRTDYPEFVKPAYRGKVPEAQRAAKLKTTSGFTIEVHGAGSSFLGLLEDDDRPSLILLDDIEPGGEHATPLSTKQRLQTLRETILGLSPFARVLWAGTTVRYNSLIHQALRSTQGEESSWTQAEKFTVYHGPAIVEEIDENGFISRRSTWPSKWSVEFLDEEQELSPREFALNYENMPLSPTAEGTWFSPDLFVYKELSTISARVIAIDPGVSNGKTTNDPNGICVVSFSNTDKQASVDLCVPLHAKSIDLKKYVVQLLNEYPDVSAIIWETNQGGTSLMYATLGEDFPIPLVPVHIPAGHGKTYRADLLLTHYKRKHIVHKPGSDLRKYQAECLDMPIPTHSPNLVDSVGIGIEFLAKAGTARPSLTVGSRRV